MSTEVRLTPSVQSQGTAQMLEWAAPISYPCTLRIFCEIGRAVSGRTTVNFFANPSYSRMRHCDCQEPEESWKRYDTMSETPYFLEKPLELAFWGVGIL